MLDGPSPVVHVVPVGEKAEGGPVPGELDAVLAVGLSGPELQLLGGATTQRLYFFL